MGSMYKPKWKDKDGTVRESAVWWIKYYRAGKPYRESTKSTKEADAKRLLKKREGEISEGKLPGIYFDKVRFDELAGDYLTDCEVNKRKSTWRARISVDHLKTRFEGMRATEITTAGVNEYILTRQKEGKSNGTINRELAALKAMFNLAAEATAPKVGQVPHIPMLEENNVREGFFEADEYHRVYDALPAHLRPILAFAYHTGWRKAEVIGLTWDRVDTKAGTVRLEARQTKNKKPRTIYLNSILLALMKEQMKIRQLGCPYVFHRSAKEIRDFRGSWKSACKKAKLKGRLFHDLRRTGVRNNKRAGISETVAMTISGHKTRSVFDRYNITDDKDLKEAARMQDDFHGLNGHSFGHNRPSEAQHQQAQVSGT